MNEMSTLSKWNKPHNNNHVHVWCEAIVTDVGILFSSVQGVCSLSSMAVSGESDDELSPVEVWFALKHLGTTVALVPFVKKPVAQGRSQTAVLPENEMGPIVGLVWFLTNRGWWGGESGVFHDLSEEKQESDGEKWVRGVFFRIMKQNECLEMPTVQRGTHARLCYTAKNIHLL